MDEEIEKKLPEEEQPESPAEENAEDVAPVEAPADEAPQEAEPQEEPKPVEAEAEPVEEAPAEAEAEEPRGEMPPLGDNPTPEAIKTFTQEQVNKLVGKAREEGRSAGYKMGYDKAHEETLGRYGVDNDDELDGLFADGSRFGEQVARYDDLNGQLREANSQLALLRSGVIPERHDDVKAILAANGMEVTEEAIKSFIPTHPEWIAAQQPAQQGAPAPEIPQPKPAMPKQDEQGQPNQSGVMGAEPSAEPEKGDDEEDMAMKLFGLKN